MTGAVVQLVSAVGVAQSFILFVAGILLVLFSNRLTDGGEGFNWAPVVLGLAFLGVGVGIFWASLSLVGVIG